MATDSQGATNSSPVTKRNAFLATFRYSLSIFFLALIVAGLIGLNPPWPAVSLFAIGMVFIVWFVVTRKPALAVAAAVVTLLVSGWPLRDTVQVREATPNDPINRRYFGIDTHDKDARVSIRNIAVVTGPFTLNTWLTASLYHVKSGAIEEINAFTVGRTPNAIGAPHWMDMEITLALGDRKVPGGRMTQLGSAGQSRGGGWNSEVINDVVPAASIILPGRISSGTKCILFVEGDSDMTLDEATTVEQFAQQNGGNYLVVEIELH